MNTRVRWNCERVIEYFHKLPVVVPDNWSLFWYHCRPFLGRICSRRPAVAGIWSYLVCSRTDRTTNPFVSWFCAMPNEWCSRRHSLPVLEHVISWNPDILSLDYLECLLISPNPSFTKAHGLYPNFMDSSWSQLSLTSDPRYANMVRLSDPGKCLQEGCSMKCPLLFCEQSS